MAQALPPQARYSTHDQTLPLGGGAGDFNEWCVDAKAPGDGRIYSVATIEVREAFDGALYSGSVVNLANGLLPFTLPGPNNRQVVLLQVTDGRFGENIVLQRFFYGETDPEVFSRATNARAISVWPADDPADVRIAICGETFDERLPLSNAPAGWNAASVGSSSGFVAVFDGNGILRWTHHLFGVDGGGNCAITDLSVRVEVDEEEGTVDDVVTFCGISSHGNPAGGNATLTTIAPFAAPSAPSACNAPADGATDNGLGQWDGIVGRLRRPYTAAGTSPGTTTEFLSIVGGNQQDGLFGIAEMDPDWFVVVGSTGTGATSGPGSATFPNTAGVCFAAAPASYSMGAVLEFAWPGAGALQWGGTRMLGDLDAAGAPVGTFTVARDVLAQPNFDVIVGGPFSFVTVVGSTNDPDLFRLNVDPARQAPQAVYGGGISDGFVFCYDAIGFSSSWGTFRGGAGFDGLTGVGGWNEFTDHVTTLGFTDDPGTLAFDVGSYWLNTSGNGATVDQLVALTQVQLDGAFNDLPTAIGLVNATLSQPFDQFGLGSPAGGGIAVDPTARVHVVGATNSNPPGQFPTTVGARAKTGLANDAVRSVLDMLPDGVGRTDGTGAIPGGGPGAYPLPGVFGGTTPECALMPFGYQLGVTPPALALPRMLIHYEGPDPAVNATGIAIVVTRPPYTYAGGVAATALQFDFPGAQVGGGGPYAPAPVLPEGWLLWTTNNPVTIGTVAQPGFASYRVPLAQLPPTPDTITAQLICLLPAPVAGGAVGPTCPAGGQSFTAASPALWFTFN